MIQLTDFQYRVLTFLAELGKFEQLSVYTGWPYPNFDELYALRDEGLLVQTNEIQGLFQLTEQGRAMFKDAEIRRIQ